MPRVVLLATTTGYQTRMFTGAAERLGVELVFATDRCRGLEDPWGDHATPIRFEEEERSITDLLTGLHGKPIDGVLVVGDQPTVLAALAAQALHLPGNPPDAARASRNTLLCREKLRAVGLLVPSFRTVPFDIDPRAVAGSVPYPAVVKPLALSGSRGVVRADDPDQFVAAFVRLRHILLDHDLRRLKDPANDVVLIERFIPGSAFALEGLLDRGRFRTLALFDKPDPLDGPFFEETIYVTPSPQPAGVQEAIARGVPVTALGLWHGPVHAECRVNEEGVFVLEAAARPIGGLCARSVRFTGPGSAVVSFEELLLRHAAGEDTGGYRREESASGVMMIPIPRRGVYRAVSGVEQALAVTGIDEIFVTAKRDQMLVPLPEGASYLGFIFARGESPERVVRTIRQAHARLSFEIDAPLPIVAGSR